MESSTSKTEIMKPLFLKAGIPLVLSIAGFIYAKITARKNIISASNPSLCDPHENTSFDEEILGLKSEIDEVKKMDLELKNHFLEVKVSESVLNEVKNMLVLEAANVEFMKREISENGRVQYPRLVEHLRMAKLENGMLRRKVKRVLLRNMKEKSRIVRGKNMKIDEAEGEILRLCNDVEIKCGFVKKLEDQVEELQRIVKAMEEEKNELLMRPNSDSSNTKQNDAEWVTKEEFNQAVKELERLREERATEIAEFIYLKWNNACLKHELMRSHEQEEFQIEEKRNHLKVLEMDGNGETQDSRFDHQEETCIGVATRSNSDQSRNEQSDKLSSSHDHGNSRRKKFIKKIKKWVEGNEHVKTRNEDHVCS